MEQLHYPLSKEEYGNSLWKVMHSYTANMPENIKPKDGKNFKNTLLDLIDKYPCEDCKEHGLVYVKENQPKGKSRQDYFNYLCEFHNDVNVRSGKPKQDCGMMLSSQPSCPTCSSSIKQLVENLPTEKSAAEVKNDTKNVSKINQLIDYRLNQQMGDYKDVSKKIVEKMSTNAGVPVPEMVFSEQTPCSNPDTSCTHFSVAPSGKLLDTKIHFNTNQYSPRTAIHETLHYIRKAKGLDWKNEKTIDEEARSILSRDFPMDRFTKTATNIKEVRDTPLETSYYKERTSRRLKSVSDNFPYFSKYYKGAKEHKAEAPAPGVYPTVTYSDGRPVYPQVPTQEPKEEPQSATEGFTSMLDPIYAPFANMLGLKPRDVNDAHTPALLANGAIVLAESNLNRFGSMAFSLLSSVLTLAAGTLAKESIGYADKKLLVGLGGAFLWNAALRYLVNPKIHEECVGQAMDFGQACSGMDFEAMVGSVTGDVPKEMDPEKIMLKGGTSGFPKDLRRNISSQVGGGTVKVGRKRSSEIDSSDIYEDPDSTIASQGTFRRSDPFFPSM